MAVFRQSGCIRTKVLYSGKSGSIQAKVVVFGRKWFYSGENGCIKAKVVAFGQSGCIQAKVFVLG